MDIKWTGTLPDVSEPFDFSEMMAEAAEYMLGSVQENFLYGGRPTAWAEKKHGRGPSYLIKNGFLLRSIRTKTDKESFKVFTTKGEIPYCFVHQFGYARRNIPARPYMIFQEEDRKHIVEMFKDRIINLFQTKRKALGTQ